MTLIRVAKIAIYLMSQIKSMVKGWATRNIIFVTSHDEWFTAFGLPPKGIYRKVCPACFPPYIILKVS
jgi:hypothetical protein